MTEEKRGRTWKAWAGFIDGKPDVFQTVDPGIGYERLYRARSHARSFYQDVRRVTIAEVSRKKRSKP